MINHMWLLDKSHYDVATGTAQIISEGFRGITHKAGGDSDDLELGAWWADTKPHRASRADFLSDPTGLNGHILPGAYWVLYPGRGSGAGDSFIARLNSQCPGWRDTPFILQLDCEEWQGNPATKPGLGDIAACANRLRVLAPNLMPIVYAPRWAYGNSLAGLRFPLWSSAYTSAKGAAASIYPGDSYTGWSAYSGIVPTIAQFSANGLVNGDPTTDVNCFKGTPTQLAAILCPGWLGDSMARNITDDDVQAIITAMRNADINPDANSGNTLFGALWMIFGRTAALNSLPGKVDAVAADVAYLRANPGSVDMAAFASTLAPQLAPLINHEDPGELATAIEQAIRDLIAPVASTQIGGGATPIYDAAAADSDAATRATRQQRQPGIMGQ